MAYFEIQWQIIWLCLNYTRKLIWCEKEAPRLTKSLDFERLFPIPFVSKSDGTLSDWLGHSISVTFSFTSIYIIIVYFFQSFQHSHFFFYTCITVNNSQTSRKTVNMCRLSHNPVAKTCNGMLANHLCWPWRLCFLLWLSFALASALSTSHGLKLDSSMINIQIDGEITATGEGRCIEVGWNLVRAHIHPLIAFGTMRNTITTWLHWRGLGTTSIQTMWSMWKDDREQNKDVNPFPKKVLMSPIG